MSQLSPSTNTSTAPVIETNTSTELKALRVLPRRLSTVTPPPPHSIYPHHGFALPSSCPRSVWLFRSTSSGAVLNKHQSLRITGLNKMTQMQVGKSRDPIEPYKARQVQFVDECSEERCRHIVRAIPATVSTHRHSPLPSV